MWNGHRPHSLIPGESTRSSNIEEADGQSGDSVPPEGHIQFNKIALAGAVFAALGLVMIVVADRMSQGLLSDYLISDMTEQDYLNQIEAIDALMTTGVVITAAAVIVVAFSVPPISAQSFDKMRRRIETDFYRRCPSCGSWNTKLVANCQTCGILMPKLPESSRVNPEPSVYKEGPT